MPVQAVTLLLRPFFSREMLVDIPPLAMACAAASRWYVRLHTKPSLSSLVCQLTHKNPSLFSGVLTYTQNPLSLLSCSAIVSSFFLLLYRGVMGNGVGGSGRFYQPDEERELIIFLTPSMVHA